MTIETIREQAAAFDRRSRRQDLASVVAFAAIVAGNTIALVFERSSIEKVGDLLSIAAALYVLTCYWRVREASPEALGATPSIEFYRDKILRRQGMMSRFWKVVLLFVPGILLSTVGDAVVSPQPPARYAMLAGAFAVLVAWVEWCNRREARRLAAELERI